MVVQTVTVTDIKNNEKMANPLSSVITHSRKSKHSNPSVYTGVANFNDHNNSDNSGDRTGSSVRIFNKYLVWNKCNPFSRYSWNWYNLLGNRRNQTFLSRDDNKTRRVSRAARLYAQLHNKLYYKLLVCLLAIGNPVFAEETVNKSNPVAAATGNVTNQAVQFQNNGASSRQQYSTGVSCNGSTLTFSPFYMGNDTKPEVEDGYNINQNWGFQLNFSIPLSNRGYEQCLEIAKRHEEKMRLDYELVRALKCTEIMQKGFTFIPNSRVAHMCSDVVPIQSLIKQEENVSTTKTNRFNFFKK
jgi:hypothetical protein